MGSCVLYVLYPPERLTFGRQSTSHSNFATGNLTHKAGKESVSVALPILVNSKFNSLSIMGKRRNAAKTGDKKLYASRNATKDTGERSPKDFDTFHTEREESYLGLDVEDPRYDDDDDDRFDGQHNVLDLAMAGDDSDSKSDDSSADDSSAEENWKQDPGEMVTSTNASFSDEASETDEDDETDALDRLDVRGWGRKKSSYYDGDLADLELGVQAEDVSTPAS